MTNSSEGVSPAALKTLKPRMNADARGLSYLFAGGDEHTRPDVRVVASSSAGPHLNPWLGHLARACSQTILGSPGMPVHIFSHHEHL
jgi:hypothetical protein